MSWSRPHVVRMRAATSGWRVSAMSYWSGRTMNPGMSVLAFSMCTCSGCELLDAMSRHLLHRFAFADAARGCAVGPEHAVEHAVRDAVHDVLLQREAPGPVRARAHRLLHVRIDRNVLAHDLRVLLVVIGADDRAEVGQLDRRLRESPVLVEAQFFGAFWQVLPELHVR